MFLAVVLFLSWSSGYASKASRSALWSPRVHQPESLRLAVSEVWRTASPFVAIVLAPYKLYHWWLKVSFIHKFTKSILHNNGHRISPFVLSHW